MTANGAWNPQAPSGAQATHTSERGASCASDGEISGIVRRAAGIGIPAWRVTTALGIPLPVGNRG